MSTCGGRAKCPKRLPILSYLSWPDENNKTGTDRRRNRRNAKKDKKSEHTKTDRGEEARKDARDRQIDSVCMSVSHSVLDRQV